MTVFCPATAQSQKWSVLISALYPQLNLTHIMTEAQLMSPALIKTKNTTFLSVVAPPLTASSNVSIKE